MLIDYYRKKQKAINAIDEVYLDGYFQGLKDGLEVAERIVGWLTRVPDTKRQKETREWAILEIEKARTVHEKRSA